MASLLGQKIKKHRKEKGLTLEGLAKEIDAGKSYVWELENRQIKPSAERLTKLASILGVTPEYLLNDEQSDAEPSVLDEAFFRKFQKLPEPTKRKIDSILDTLKENN